MWAGKRVSVARGGVRLLRTVWSVRRSLEAMRGAGRPRGSGGLGFRFRSRAPATARPRTPALGGLAVPPAAAGAAASPPPASVAAAVVDSAAATARRLPGAAAAALRASTRISAVPPRFKCEICGNFSYWGRRNFNRHFQESRHAHGMRCLKIPNTKHFHDITVIEDAIALYSKIKASSTGAEWQAETEEEFEDSEGNVLSKKTFDDLARQGLL